MAYNKFTVGSVRKQFALQVDEVEDLFAGVSPVAVSQFTLTSLQRHVPLAEAIGTEKAKSEFIVAPMLSELRELEKQRISLFSGLDFTVDRSLGLSGRCDFIISASPSQFSLRAPILMMVEAKDDNINEGLGQCMAEMIAAQRFNEREENPTKAIFGCVTTGSNWRFLKLEEKKIVIDEKQYFIENPEQILGILVHITKTAPVLT
jgi:hypothetical protein